MKNILFLCTGNSCRSQMAEGWLKHFGRSVDYHIYSAGIKKHGINYKAIKVMQEAGVDISRYVSKTIAEIPKITFDYVFTLCSDANETCPIFPGGKIIHVPFDDPPKLVVDMKDEQKILDVYRRVRDEIKEFALKIDTYL